MCFFFACRVIQSIRDNPVDWCLRRGCTKFNPKYSGIGCRFVLWLRYFVGDLGIFLVIIKSLG